MRSFLEKLLICSVVLTLFIAYIPFGYFALQAEAKNVEEKSEEKKPIELVELRTENAKTFDNLDGTYTAEIAQEPIHYQDKQGNWEEIDNSLVETNNGKTVTNKANDFSVELDKTTAASQQNITITDDEKKIDFGLVSAQHEKDNKNEQVQNAKGVIDNNTIRYQNVLKDTDLVYTIGSNQIKEDIIYSEKPKDGFPKKFTYKLNIPGMNVLKEEDNIYLVNSKTKQKLYLITAPYMYDSFVPKGFVSTKGVTSIPEEAISYDIKLDYEEVNGEHFIHVIPNKEWLESNERIYPITIDPTIVNLQSMPYVEDTNLRSAFPTQTGGNDQELGSGKASDGNIIRTLMKFDVSSLPKDAVVLNSNLNLWYSSTNNTSAIDIGLYKVTKNWEENEASWTYAQNNPFTSWSSKGGDYDVTKRLSVTNIGAPSELDNDMKSWDIPANIVEGWIKNSATNQGLLLKSEQENLAIYKKFVSSEKSILQKYKPLISITYAEPAAELQKSENLLLNGDFEGNLPLNGWKKNNYNTGTITQDQTESSPKSNDNRSLKITVPKGSWDLKETLPDLKQEIKVEGAQLYDISFYAKQNIKGLGTTIDIMEWSDDDKATSIDFSQISESSDWTQHKKSFKTSPNAKSIIITISPFRSMQESESYGEVYLDSISFGKVSNLEEEVHETHDIWALFKNKKSLSTVEIDPDKKAHGQEFSFRHTIPNDKGIVSEEKAYARKIIPVEKLTSYYIKMQQMVGSDSKNIIPNIKVILKDEDDNTIKTQNFSGSSKGGIWSEIKGIITTTENTKNIEVRTDFIRDSVNESQGDIWFSNGLFVNRIEPTISDELITNGEFKEELFNNWIVDKDSSGTAEITTGTFNKGKSSLALTFTSNDILNSLSVMQEVNIEPNTVYEISGFSKMLKQTDELEPSINIEFLNRDGLIPDGLSSTTLHFNKEAWTQKKLKFKTTPTTSKIRIKLTAYGLSAKSGTVYFDDLSLHKFYGAPILNYGSLLIGQNLLKNASFNSTLDNWNVEHYDDSSTVSTDTVTSPFSDDSKSLKVGVKTTAKKDDFGNDDFGNVLIKQKVNIEPNSYYVLDGYVKELNLKNAVYQLNIVIHNKDKTTEDYYYMAFGNSYSDPNEWIKKRLGIKTGSNASQVEVILQIFTKGIEASGTVWFDDLKLVKQNFINDYDLSPLGGSTFRPEMSVSQLLRQIEIPSFTIDFGSTFEEMNATLREMEIAFEKLEKVPWDQIMKDFNEAGDKMNKAFKQINTALAQMNSAIDELVKVQGEMIDIVNKTNQVMDNIIKKQAEMNQSIYSLTYDSNKMSDILSTVNNVSTAELKKMFANSFDLTGITINGKPAAWSDTSDQDYEDMNERMSIWMDFMPVLGQINSAHQLTEGIMNKNATTYDLVLATIGVVGGGVGKNGVKTTIEVSGDAIKEVDKIVTGTHRKNNQRSRFRQYTGYEASGVVHHGLPEELSWWFTERGVNVNDPKYYYDLDVGTHNRTAENGIHTNKCVLGNNWNVVWKEWKDKNQEAEVEEIEEQLEYMEDTCKITEFRAQPKKK